jgi:hypothetical protein
MTKKGTLPRINPAVDSYKGWDRNTGERGRDLAPSLVDTRAREAIAGC